MRGGLNVNEEAREECELALNFGTIYILYMQCIETCAIR